MNREKLIVALTKLFPSVARNSVSEEFGDFRFIGKTLRACDGITMVQVTLDEDTGLDCRIPAEGLFKLLKGRSVADIDITLKGDELKIKGKGLKATYKVIPAKGGMLDNLDFDIDEWKEIPKGFLESIQKAAFASSKDSDQGVLCGVYVGKKRVIGSDGQRISCTTRKSELVDKSIIMPGELVAQLKMHSSSIDGWAIKGETIYFKVGEDTILAGQQIAGQYPSRVIAGLLKDEREMTTTVEFPEEAIQVLKSHAVQQAVETAGVDEAEVTVSFGEEGLTVHSTNAEHSYSLDDSLDIGEAAEAVKFKIDPGVLADLLQKNKKMKIGEGTFVAFTDKGHTYLAVVDKE